jgi:hypothetical protein
MKKKFKIQNHNDGMSKSQIFKDAKLSAWRFQVVCVYETGQFIGAVDSDSTGPTH